MLKMVSIYKFLYYIILHLGKTECVLFGPRRKLLKYHQKLQCKCKEQVIKSQDSVRYLGLYIDKYTSCEKKVNSIIGKVNSRLKFLNRNCRLLNSSTRLSLSTAQSTAIYILYN